MLSLGSVSEIYGSLAYSRKSSLAFRNRPGKSLGAKHNMIGLVSKDWPRILDSKLLSLPLRITGGGVDGGDGDTGGWGTVDMNEMDEQLELGGQATDQGWPEQVQPRMGTVRTLMGDNRLIFPGRRRLRRGEGIGRGNEEKDDSRPG